MDNKAVIQCYKNNEFINGLSGFDTQNKNNKIVYMDTIPATKLTLDKTKVNVAKSVLDSKFNEIINNSGLGEHVNIEEELSSVESATPETENPDDCG